MSDPIDFDRVVQEFLGVFVSYIFLSFSKIDQILNKFIL
jgi:hypothetical protein